MAEKEYELTYAVLRYAADCLQEGDWPALRDLGFGPKEIEALRNLTLAELGLLARRLAGHALKARLDRPAFWAVLDQVRWEHEHRALRMEFVRRDAPAEMMQALFGMGAKEYAACRRAAEMPPSVGRPSEPDEETAHRVWQAWQDAGVEPGQAGPRDWLAVADATGVSLRVIWRLVQRWMEPPVAATAAGAAGAGR